MEKERPPRRGSGDTSSSSSSGERDKEEKAGDIRQLWGIFIFAVIGATATTYAVGQLRRTADWIYTQAPRPESSYKGGKAHRSFRTSFQEESRKRYNRRIQEEYEQEMERVERIRRMQSAFNREKNKYKRGYERWNENSYTYHQQFEREEWYWKANPSFQYRRTPFGDTPRDNAPRSLSHHYAVLGLDRLRTRPYTDDEIKTAFRVKAKQFHPDQNQDNKEVAEAKFKEIMASYDAIKTERKDNTL